jgi:hypothetical protein
MQSQVSEHWAFSWQQDTLPQNVQGLCTLPKVGCQIGREIVCPQDPFGVDVDFYRPRVIGMLAIPAHHLAAGKKPGLVVGQSFERQAARIP